MVDFIGLFSLLMLGVTNQKTETAKGWREVEYKHIIPHWEIISKGLKIFPRLPSQRQAVKKSLSVMGARTTPMVSEHLPHTQTSGLGSSWAPLSTEMPNLSPVLWLPLHKLINSSNHSSYFFRIGANGNLFSMNPAQRIRNYQHIERIGMHSSYFIYFFFILTAWLHT